MRAKKEIKAQREIKTLLKLDPLDPKTGHLWRQRKTESVTFCCICGNVKKKDSENSRCRGKVHISLR